jgi:hypothetical protein
MSCGGTTTADLATLKIHTDELDRGINVVRDALRWGTAPEACEVWARQNVEGDHKLELELKLQDPPEFRYRAAENEQSELFFLLVGMDCKETGWRWRPWQSRLPLSFMDEVKSLPGVEVPADFPYTDDDSIELKTADGGLMRVYFTKLGEEDGTESLKCILAVKKVTKAAAVAIYTLLETGLGGAGLALMPSAIVTKEPPEAEEPRTYTKLDAEELLLEVLEAGPLAWWEDGRRPYRGARGKARYEQLRRRKRRRPERQPS